MANTLLRLGLWTLILVLVLYVLATTYESEPWAEMIPLTMAHQMLVVAGALIVAGILMRILGKGAQVVTKNRCRVCRTPIAGTGMYCREHLRTILAEEDEKTHMTRVRR